jgi:hypothetical protein
VVEQTSPVLELQLGFGRWSFVITNDRNHLLATTCIDLPVCGEGLSELWVTQRPSDTAATNLVRYTNAMIPVVVGPTLAMPGNLAVRVNGIVFEPESNVLYGVTSADTGNGLASQLVTINSETAEVTVVGPLGTNIRDLTFVDQILYGVNFDANVELLFEINTATGAAVHVGASKFVGSSKAIGLTTGSSKVLYATDSKLIPTSLFSLDQTTGVPTVEVAALQDGEDGRFYGPLAMSQDALMYAVKRNSASDTQFFADMTSLATINRFTGEVTDLTAPQNEPFNGIAIRYS